MEHPEALRSRREKPREPMHQREGAPPRPKGRREASSHPPCVVGRWIVEWITRLDAGRSGDLTQPTERLGEAPRRPRRTPGTGPCDGQPVGVAASRGLPPPERDPRTGAAARRTPSRAFPAPGPRRSSGAVGEVGRASSLVPISVDAGLGPNLTLEYRERFLERDSFGQQGRSEAPPSVMDRLVDRIPRDAEVRGHQVERFVVKDVGQEDSALVRGELPLDQAPDQPPRVALQHLPFWIRSLALEWPVRKRIAEVRGRSALPAPTPKLREQGIDGNSIDPGGQAALAPEAAQLGPYR